jgi:hypothetical protein
MGTTLATAALVVGGDGRDVIALANVGDSRAYLYTAGRLTQVTRDHSLAEEKVRFGELTEAEAAVHPHRHILTRALGVGPDVDIDLWELHLRTGDRLLLCSDGLTNEVPEARIAEVLAAEPDPDSVAHQLVQEANDHGGNDNITVLLVDVLVGDDEVATPDVVSSRSAGDGDPGMAVASAATPNAAAGGALRPQVRSDLTGMGPAVSPAVDTAARVGTPSNGGPVTVPPPAPPVPLWTQKEPPPVRLASRAGPEPRRESRRARRRRLGIPRRVTFRVVLFTLLVAALVAAAYFFVRWYATDNWYVTIRGDQLVVYQGRPGGLLWFEPKLVDRTGVTTAQVLPLHLGTLQHNVQEPSLAAADRYVRGLQQEAAAQAQANSPSSTTSTVPTTTTTTPPSTTTPTAASAAGPLASGRSDR